MKAPPRNSLHLGDNLGIMKAWPSGFVDLIYIDPPFNTGKTQRLQSIKLNRGSKTRGGFKGKNYSYDVVSDHSYEDAMPLEAYLDFLGRRVEEGRRLLKENGSFFLHIDPRHSHHVRFLMDGIFGAERFVNEIVWAYDYGGRPRDRWPPKHDCILWYAKGRRWTFDREESERIPYMAPGLVGPEKAARGKLPTDVWWMTIVPTNSKERTGYPTQKPVKLLERIIRSCSGKGGLVLDFFAGSGTTAVAASGLKRDWILIDRNPSALKLAKKRLSALKR